jgi:hypothetical protein
MTVLGPPALSVLVLLLACTSATEADTFWVNKTPSLWTSRDPLSLGIQKPGQFWGHTGPSTVEFVPATSPGWSVTLPGGDIVAAADPCG